MLVLSGRDEGCLLCQSRRRTDFLRSRGCSGPRSLDRRLFAVNRQGEREESCEDARWKSSLSGLSGPSLNPRTLAGMSEGAERLFRGRDFKWDQSTAQKNARKLKKSSFLGLGRLFRCKPLPSRSFGMEAKGGLKGAKALISGSGSSGNLSQTRGDAFYQSRGRATWFSTFCSTRSSNHGLLGCNITATYLSKDTKDSTWSIAWSIMVCANLITTPRYTLFFIIASVPESRYPTLVLFNFAISFV